MNTVTNPEKNSPEKLKEQVDLFVRIFDSVQNGIMITDAQGYVTHMNRPYGDFLGIDPAEQIGRHCTEVVENTRMHIVGRTGKSEINHIQTIKGMNIVVQRIPVKKDDRVIAVFGRVMFSDIREFAKLAQKLSHLESKVKLYEQELLNLRSTRYTFDSIIGNTRAMTDLKEEALRATSNNFPVMITGESGTGKEVFAQAIHHSSSRKIHPFVRINCAAIPKNLLESELFGYEKGAFTGAGKQGKPGKFELAHRGTVFLDEIGDLPVDMQPKLLRVIEEKEFERIGGTKVVKSDFRVIAATNRNLQEMIRENQFRSDLFYRLNVIPLYIPPLRERREDIGEMAVHLTRKLCRETDFCDVTLSEKALEILSNFNWPGNVRELTNVLERTLSRINRNVIQPKDLPFYIKSRSEKETRNHSGSLRSVTHEAEKQALEDALEANGYNKAKTARFLGIHRTLLYKKLRRYGIPLSSGS